MSGGLWSYRDEDLKTEIFGYTNKWNGENVLEDLELSEMLYDMFSLLHEYDWYKEGDTNESKYLKAKKKFKDKWLNNSNVRVQKVIDTAINGLKQELYKTYGVNSNNSNDK